MVFSVCLALLTSPGLGSFGNSLYRITLQPTPQASCCELSDTEPNEDSDDSEEDSWYEEDKGESDNDEDIVLDEFGEAETGGRSFCYKIGWKYLQPKENGE